MSQDDDNQQTQEQPAEAPAPDGLMAGAALAEDKASDEEESISHLAEDAEQAEVEDEDEESLSGLLGKPSGALAVPPRAAIP